MTQTPFARSARRLAVLLTAGAVGLIGLSLARPPPGLGTAAFAANEQQASGSRGAGSYDLTDVQMLRQVVVHIKDNYVDPERINPKEMFVSALEQIEKSTAEVMVEGTAREGKVKVTVGATSRSFDVHDIESVWMIPHRIRPVFAFIQDNLVTTQDKRDIEYSAINGMLSTLDPHSWLLKPDVYREMKLQTKGEFGGVGFVISMEEEKLTVKKVLKNTPASRAGIKRNDHISRIGDDSTINMDLNDAVSKLRGAPGTEVSIYVRRDGKPEKEYRVTRDLISIESVTSMPLAQGVGYVRLASFAGTTSRDLAAAIRELQGKNDGQLKGLVLDLRSNPGGLLDQAIQVADQFISSGTLVTTAGMSDKMRVPKKARNDGGEHDFPVVVLVNSESASASEIVAGALKNLNRAVIVGRQTFGKGSVQVLYDLPTSGKPDEEAALKLTIQQYLTPGDKSIQEVGVTPDIELVPAIVTRKSVDLFAPPRTVREADLDKHFAQGFEPTVASGKPPEPEDKPLEMLRYLHPLTDKDQEAADSEQLASEEPDEERIPQDPQVQFARDLLLNAPHTDRAQMLSASRAWLQTRRAEEQVKIEKAVQALGLDWSASKTAPQGVTDAEVTFTTSPAVVRAGETVTLTTTVQNNGQAPLEQLRAWTRCDAPKESYQAACRLFARKEFLLGKVEPGKKKSWSVEVKVPRHLPSVHETLTLVLEDAHGAAPEARTVAIDVVEAARPSFAFTWQVLDADGLAQPGETVDVRVDVKNVGTGASSKKAYVSLRNSDNDKIFMKKGRVVFGELAPGKVASAMLSMELREGLEVDADGVPLKLEIGDRDTFEFTTGEVHLPSLPEAPALAVVDGVATASRELYVRAAPLTRAPVVAKAQKAAVLPVTGRVNGFLRVAWAEGQQGFVAADDVVYDAARKARASGVARAMEHEPPDISLAGLDSTKAPIVVSTDKVSLSGTAVDEAGLLDVRVFLDNEKVFFRTGRGPRGQHPAEAARIDFDPMLPLKVGNNTVFIVARENEAFSSQRTLVIYRKPPAVAEHKTDAAPAKTQ